MASSIPIEYEYFLDRSIWPRDGTVKGTTSLVQSGPGNNVNEGVTPHNLDFQN